MKNIIKFFEIKGLYSERNVSIDFKDNIKIIVAENGYGKTTILNALYAILSGEVTKLKEIEFESMSITFSDNEKLTIKSKELDLPKFDSNEAHLYKHISNKIGRSETNKLMESFFYLPRKEFVKSNKLKYASKKIGIDTEHLASILSSLTENGNEKINNKSRENLEKIKSKFPYKIVYLPTYRRVEHDFKDISEDNIDGISNDNSINFGMRDVKKEFKEITGEIITSSLEWFSKVNGKMLSQLVTGIEINEETISSIKNPEAIKIVLDRIGDNIEEESKQEIIRLIESKEIFKGHDQLVYFISNLVKVYERQRSNDKAIQDFSEVCNKYLVDKKIHYNESKVTINIVRRKNEREVNIENLSSGEKQIISLFARLYLKREDDLAIFYDEPELSLSLEWQKKLLPDIIKSNKCAFMFVTTHSPFIFENELISNTVDLGSYIEEL